MSVTSERNGAITIITLNRPTAKNAVDGPTACALAEAFRRFEQDPDAKVAVLYGGSSFCAGADLKAVSSNINANRISSEGDGPMGPSRMLLSKPVIAAIEGHAVAGGLELALWCDMRVAAEDAILGVFCRRFGVPLIDGGTVRLPRLIGMSHAMDLILTGRPVNADEALRMGLVNRVCKPGNSLAVAEALAMDISQFPSECMLHDRASTYEQWDMPLDKAIENEFQHGMHTITSGETHAGATRFKQGDGRHGNFDTPGS
jgi:enoyl-CoA hydratase